MIIHKAIGLLDQIYLNNKDISIENIEIISSICLLLAFEFNNCCCIIDKNESIRKINNSSNFSFINNTFLYVNNIIAMYQYLIKEIKNIKYWQIFCLKNLDYNLNKYSSFDYLNLFFGLGIIFTKENIDILSLYDYCFYLLDILINQYTICKYNQYTVAMSIIYLKFNNCIYFNDKTFKYIYGVDFSKQKYKSCISEINQIISNLYNINFYYIPLNNYQNINNNDNNYNINRDIINKNILNNYLIFYINNIKQKINNGNNKYLIREFFTQFAFFLVKMGKINYQDLLYHIQINNLCYEIFLSFLFKNHEIKQIGQNIKNGISNSENKESNIFYEKEGKNFKYK